MSPYIYVDATLVSSLCAEATRRSCQPHLPVVVIDGNKLLGNQNGTLGCETHVSGPQISGTPETPAVEEIQFSKRPQAIDFKYWSGILLSQPARITKCELMCEQMCEPSVRKQLRNA